MLSLSTVPLPWPPHATAATLFVARPQPQVNVNLPQDPQGDDNLHRNMAQTGVHTPHPQHANQEQRRLLQHAYGVTTVRLLTGAQHGQA